MALTSGAALSSLFRGRFERSQTLRQMEIVSVESMPVLVLVSILGGFVMVLESATYIESTGATGLLGWVFGLTTLSEVAPVLVALMFAARSGARTTAELGTMSVTGQIDAMRLLGVDPAAWLGAPRFLAMIVMLPLMVAMCDVFALAAGAVGASAVVHVPPLLFWQSLRAGHLLDELLMGLVKGVFFGGAIAAVSCTHGLKIRGGASGVGRAVNDCVVASALSVFLIDYLVTVVWLQVFA